VNWLLGRRGLEAVPFYAFSASLPSPLRLIFFHLAYTTLKSDHQRKNYELASPLNKSYYVIDPVLDTEARSKSFFPDANPHHLTQ